MGMRSYNYPILVNSNIAINGPTSGNIASSAQPVEYSNGFSVQAVYTGTQPQGTIMLQASNDNVNFVTVTGSSASLPGSTGSIVWNVRDPNYFYSRINFLGSSATSGVLNAWFTSKARA